MQEKEGVMKAKIFAGLIGIIVLLTAQMSRAESMKVNLISIGAVTHGTMNSNTNYSSLLHDGFLLQNRYEFEAHEVGGKCTVMQTLELADTSDINGASLYIQMEPLADSTVYLATEEKIGTGILRTRAENQENYEVEKFSGAAGSGLGVTETLHFSESRTDNGNIGHLVKSEGQGEIKAGMIGNYFLYEGPAPEDGVHDPLCPLWSHEDEVVELANQSFEYHIRHRGGYSYEFEGEIGPPSP
jgi:hypothetical protein